jgi:hypothetical protein
MLGRDLEVLTRTGMRRMQADVIQTTDATEEIQQTIEVADWIPGKIGNR